MLWFKALGLAEKMGVVLLVVAAVAVAALALNHFTDRAFEAAEESGAANVRVIVAEKGMKNVEDANKAAGEVAADPVARNAGCVRHSRTPENC